MILLILILALLLVGLVLIGSRRRAAPAPDRERPTHDGPSHGETPDVTSQGGASLDDFTPGGGDFGGAGSSGDWSDSSDSGGDSD